MLLCSGATTTLSATQEDGLNKRMESQPVKPQSPSILKIIDMEQEPDMGKEWPKSNYSTDI